MESDDGATCADRTTGRRAHTRPAAVARHGSDSRTIAGIAGAAPTAQVTGTIHRSQDLWFVASIGQTLVRQRESRGAEQYEGEPKECADLLHASAKHQDFLLEVRRTQVRHVQADDDVRCFGEPPSGRRARDAEIRGDGHVAGTVNEILKPVVVASLMASRRRHGIIIGRPRTAFKFSNTFAGRPLP